VNPTDTFIQAWAQALGGDGYMMGWLLLMCAFALLATAGAAACIHELWQSRRRKEDKRQRQLERSVSRARGGHERI
jgi:hypothetical protein